MRHLEAPDQSVVRSVFNGWSELVGDLIGAHSRPTRIVGGTLFVEVDDPAWASELNWLSDELLESIRSRLETSEINEISVKIGR